MNANANANQPIFLPTANLSPSPGLNPKRGRSPIRSNPIQSNPIQKDAEFLLPKTKVPPYPIPFNQLL
jgi:hypothetical protein